MCAQESVGLFESGEIPLNSWWMHVTMHSICSGAASPLCLLLGGVYAGHDSDQINRTAVPFYLDYIPDSISIKNVRHFAQQFGKDNYFRRFDYGYIKNIAIYGRGEPPAYNLSRITFPTSIYFGNNDFLVNPQDVAELSNFLPNQVRPPFRIPSDSFNHIDFFLAIDVKNMFYNQVIKDILKDEMDGTSLGFA